ncbi:L-alanine-DL-glutamate epimerase-like enolase superfamily enzyme [Geomicrobium halophilum]|uniref:L-alanine-DL-glutamate epimerase-like enolase superfamily enzyme n=1 Tax=Geomicrobium halophilum TaxID=549000 RepID=A0A841PLS5_9BACL|nr:L-alanine-DL-glutamate epimerase-like enolase superfamily enzyme [Geomicrobium halophilum]
MVDANMKWTVETVIKVAKELNKFNVLWLEEPTIPDDYDGYGRISKEGGLAIAAGENLHTIYEFQNMISREILSLNQMLLI